MYKYGDLRSAVVQLYGQRFSPTTPPLNSTSHTACNELSCAATSFTSTNISPTMSLLRTPRVLQLSRALRSSSQPLRCLSTTTQRSLGEPNPRDIPDVAAMQATEDQASMVVAEQKPAAPVEQYHDEHAPDYTATIDHGTSTFSPVPKRVMNGSEPGDILPAAVLSGAPVDLQARVVR